MGSKRQNGKQNVSDVRKADTIAWLLCQSGVFVYIQDLKIPEKKWKQNKI